MNNSLGILAESLDLKIELLKEIDEYNRRQEEAFSKDNPDMESFDDAIEEKGRLIERLEKLDEGFESLYQSLKEELDNNREKYSTQIRDLQKKIAVVSEMSMSIQAQEARNKKLIENFFTSQKVQVRKNRVGSKVAYDYYKNMSGTNVAPSIYMDSKQ